MLAKHTLKLCHRVGINIEGIIDPKKIGSTIDGLDVIDVSDIATDSIVLISVLNNFVSIEQVVKALNQHGIENVLTPPEVFFKLGQLGIDSEWYWLSTNKQYVEELSRKSRELLTPILDDFSNETLEIILKYRCSGTIDETHVQEIDLQYYDTGIKNFWSGSVTLLDGGAFDGDTILSATKFNVNLKKVMAFEPDPTNYRKLQSNLSAFGFKVETYNAGLSAINGEASFTFTSSTGSSLSEDSGQPNTRLICFDSLAPNNEISHIKLDVEGSEADALIGMRKSIKLFNPDMAISVYHKPEDIYRIPKLVMDLGNYNKFSLRNYAHQSFETIFYACNE